MTTHSDKEDYLKESFPKIYLEKAGENQIKKILQAIQKVPWSVTFLQLAWTAGPVTFLALQGGYFLGYGKSAPLPLFAYFASYTLIAGFFAVIVSFTQHLLQTNKLEKAEYNLLYSFDKIADLIIHFCDFRLSQLSPLERKYESAHIILKNSHALPAAVAIAVGDITDNQQIARTVKELEVFRHVGLFSRSQDLIQLLKGKRKQQIEKFIHTHPEMAHFLEMRLNGLAPSLKSGIPRSAGFLERVFAAAEAGDLSLMTTRDAEECLILIFELISDRQIQIINFSYTGDKRLREAASDLENVRAKYRLSYATLKYRLNLLKSSFLKLQLITAEEFTPDAFEECLYECIGTLANEIKITISNKKIAPQEIKRVKQFIKMINLYSVCQTTVKELQYQRKKLTKSMKRWQTLSAAHSDRKTTLNLAKGKRGLSLIEKNIHLSHDQKLALSEKMVTVLEEFYEEYPNTDTYDESGIKELSVSLILALEPFADLSHPVIQYAIEHSNAANLGSLEYGVSVQAKAGWTAGMVKEVEKDLSRSAEKLAEVLVKQYAEKLDDDAIDFLCETYGARKNILKRISQQTTSVKEYDSKLQLLIPELIPLNPKLLNIKDIAIRYIKTNT